LKYADRLKKCKLPTLHYCRLREDMIETYKTLTSKYDMVAVPSLSIAWLIY